MGSGSSVTQNEEGKKKYNIYVEDYVLSYLRREADSLELSEIYFYGERQDGGRKIFVYGAGRNKGIEAFSKYEPLSELVCRLTQAGPVFMVREPNGECNVNGFQVFYESNEAMQSYLLEWTGSTDKKGDVKKREKGEEALPILIPSEKKPKKEVHGAISVQLCLILMLLTAIVITSTDSYDKIKQLNQSAKEVFFAIENQEAEDDAEGFESEQNRDDPERLDEIVVERDVTADREPMEKIGDTGAITDIGSEYERDEKDAGEEGETVEAEDKPEEGLLEPVQGEPIEKTEDQKPGAESNEAEKEETAQKADEEPEEGEEALSRSVTRYYEVEQGDTLYTISQKIYGDISRVEKICEVNQITDPDKIRSGQRIILP